MRTAGQEPIRTWFAVASWLLPAVLAIAVFANSVGNGFVRDDVRTIERNEFTHSLERPLLLFGSAYWASTDARLYRPLTLLSYAVDHAVGGPSPRGYHLTNIGLHALNSSLVALLLLSLSHSPLPALVAGVLFAVHPVHVEVVANVAGRPDLLATAAFLVALLGHRAAAQGGPRRTLPLHLAVLAAFAAALLSKEIAITFLALPVLHDLCFPVTAHRPAAELRRRTREYVGLAVVAGGYLAMRSVILGGLARDVIPYQANPLAHVGTLSRLMSAAAITPRYLLLFLYPDRLVCDYSVDAVRPVLSVGDPLFLGGSLLLLVAGVASLRCWRSEPLVTFLVGFTAATYSVVANAFLPIGTIMGERLIYLPSVGLCGLVATLVHAALRRLVTRSSVRNLTLMVGLASVTLPLSLRTARRNLDWRSERDLYLHDVQVSPRSASLQFNAGSLLLDAGQVDEAIDHLQESLRIYPTPQASFTLGRAHGLRGEKDLKQARYRSTVEQFPGTFWAHFAAAWLAAQDRDYGQARDHFQAAVKLRPDDATARFNLGLLQLRLGDPAAAVEQFEQATGLSNRSELTRIESLGDACVQLGRNDRAVEVWSDGFQRFPAATALLEKLVDLEYRLDRPESAATHARRLLALQPNHPRREHYERRLQQLDAQHSTSQ